MTAIKVMTNPYRDPHLDADPFAQADLNRPFNSDFAADLSDPSFDSERPLRDADKTCANTIEESQAVQEPLRSLIREHGLVSVLEALRGLIALQADRLRSLLEPEEQAEPMQAFEMATVALTDLIRAIPAELDVELALAQITHTAPTLEPAAIKLGAE